MPSKLRHRAGESIYSWGKVIKAYCWPCLLKANCLWLSLRTGTEKKAFARSITAYHVPRDMLICSSKDTAIWYSSYNWSYYLVEFSIATCHFPWSICILHWTDKRIKRQCGGNPCIFQVLNVGTNFYNSSKNVLFWFTIFFVRGNFKGFHLAFPITISLTPLVRERVWEFCQLLSSIYPNYTFWNVEITT